MDIKNFQRKRWAVFVNHQTQKAVVVDVFSKQLLKMRSRIFAWAEVVDDARKYFVERGRRTRMVMVTLTYRRVQDYRPGHMNYYLKNLKQMLGDGLLAWAWVAELQERGAVHYHLVLVVFQGTNIPMPDVSHKASNGRTYKPMWSHGRSNMRTAKTSFYLVTYTGKESQKDLSRYPKGCRMYASSIRALDGFYREVYRHRAGLPKEYEVLDKYGNPRWTSSITFRNAEGGDPPASPWSFAGSSVSKGYAEQSIAPSDYVIKSPKTS